jgi:integrase
MASIFKRNKRAKHGVYSIQYVDHDGRRRTVKGFTDKGLTQELASKLESEARLRKTGLVDPEQERFLDQKLSPLELHLAAYERSLADNNARYVQGVMNRIRSIATGCEFTRLADIQPEPVQAYLRGLREAENGIGHRTYNHYLQSIDGFLNWCVTTQRLLRNPLLGTERLNCEVDVRRQRRALTAAEVAKLIQAARKSTDKVQRYTGEQRARIYELAYMTGLRRGELGSLTPRSFDLAAKTPTLTVEAAFSKHRKKDTLPLHPELAAKVREWIAGLGPKDNLFPRLERRKTWVMVQHDLENAGIPYETADGVADFHAAGRHSHITELFRSGASLPEAKELARHSDIKTTMRYTHIGLDDQAKAVAKLPAPKFNPPTELTPAALHGRCNPSVSESHKLSQPVAEQDAKKRQNPCNGKGFDTDRRQLSQTDPVGVTGRLLNYSPRRWPRGAAVCGGALRN